MKILFYILLFFLLGFIKPIYAQQNLIPDPSMENYYTTTHPSSPSPCIFDSAAWSANWYDPNGASSDYITYMNYYYCSNLAPVFPQNNFGWQWPKEGDAYYHFAFNYVETAIDTHTQGICAISTLGFYDSRASILCEFLCKFK